MSEIEKLNLPCLKGKMGDWFYYISLLSFSEVAKRIRLPKEIDTKYRSQEELKLGEWIQREIKKNRINEIVEYLKNQDQRFFNSLILGMYDGKPGWSEISVKTSELFDEEEDLDYFSKTFGILTLTGKESIFAIDGQHRALSIRQAVKEDPELAEDEICAIFIAHRTNDLGKVRTRRLFSTLNRYAKPVNKKEIIALSEDDNCAIITRKLVEEYLPFADRILISGNKAVSPKAINSFTSIISLYEFVERLLTNKSIPGYGKSSGAKHYSYTNTRVKDEELDLAFESLKQIFDKMISEIPAFRRFFIKNQPVKRSLLESSLLFRPIGQKVLFDVYKAMVNEGKQGDAINFFKRDDFDLTHKVWKEVFWDKETETIVTDPSRQRFATLLILEYLGLPVKRTKKDLEILANFGVTHSDL